MFWQSARTRKQAGPNVRTPTARAAGIADLEIVVDSHEQYPYRFTGQQVRTVRRALPCGDYPGGGREWDWSETGTRHSPGIQPADIEELLRHGAAAVVLSRGMDLQLQVSQLTLEFLEERDVKAYVAETTEADQIYNELAATQQVGGLFHSTC